MNNAFDKYLPVLSLGTLTLFAIGYFLLEPPARTDQKDALSFSNTASWDARYLALASSSTRYPEKLYEAITLPPPPANTSLETSQELSELHAEQKLRTVAKLKEIAEENDHSAILLGGYTLKDFADGQAFPATATLLRDSFYDVTVITMRKKQHFDRVRPSVLEPTLETVIEVPGHPAYPSGHSTQAHFIAYVFGALAPARRDEFIARADAIAKNREIAGLHYPSDTAAGVVLAKQVFNSLMSNERFLTLLAAAKQEWAMHPELVKAPTNP